MTILKRSVLTALAAAALFVPTAFASAATATVQNLASASPLAKTNVTFSLAMSGFNTPYFQLSDSFPNSTVSSGNMNFGGNFQWVPSTSDIGTHTLTISVHDSDGNYTTVTQVINVLPPPSISIQNLSPGNTLMPGAALTFNVSAPGFSNPKYIPSDSFSGSTVSNGAVITSSGNFTWTPDSSQNGDHTITIYASDSSGNSAYATVNVRVGAGPSVSLPTNFTTTTYTPGQTVTFNLLPANFSPTGFSLADSFPNTTLNNSNITATGLFTWTPAGSDAGTHVVKLIGQVGVYGTSASTTMTLYILGPGGILPPTNSPVTTTTASTTTSGSSVADLLAQLTQLQSKLGSAGSTASSNTTSGFSFTSYLKPGSQTDEVMQLQTLLAKLGFLSVAPNGYYGPSTTAAVKKFQAAHGLDQLGVVGPGTRVALNAALGTTPAPTNTASSVTANGYVFEHFMGVGDDDPDVMELQNRLVTLKFMTAAPTGYYGTGTEAAVKKFQTAHGIPATGYVAANTRSALNQ